MGHGPYTRARAHTLISSRAEPRKDASSSEPNESFVAQRRVSSGSGAVVGSRLTNEPK